MADEKSCKNCAYYQAWVDATCCPYQILNMCESRSLKYFEPKDQEPHNCAGIDVGIEKRGEGQHIMTNIGELKVFCEQVEREYGSDANVILQIYSRDGELIRVDYATGATCDHAGTLFLANRDFKGGE